jgi:hypothetical protein
MHDMTRYNWLCDEIMRLVNEHYYAVIYEDSEPTPDEIDALNARIEGYRSEKRKIEQELADHGNL